VVYMTTSPAPTPEDVTGNRYRCNCGWSHTVREDAEGCREDTDVILLHIDMEHPEIGARAEAMAEAEVVSGLRPVVLPARSDSDPRWEEAIRYRAERFKAFQARADEQRELLKDRVIDAVTEGGMAEAEAARLAGVTRMTVRAWLGK
jgi:hypothetical protein